MIYLMKETYSLLNILFDVLKQTVNIACCVDFSEKNSGPMVIQSNWLSQSSSRGKPQWPSNPHTNYDIGPAQWHRWTWSRISLYPVNSADILSNSFCIWVTACLSPSFWMLILFSSTTKSNGEVCNTYGFSVALCISLRSINIWNVHPKNILCYFVVRCVSIIHRRNTQKFLCYRSSLHIINI